MSDDKNEFELTDIDPSQIARYKYSSKYNADRVVIVGGEGLNIQANIPDQKVQIVEIEKPFIVKEIEIREVEKLVIVEKEKIIEIEKPVVVKEIQLVEVIREIPVYQEKVITVSVPQIVEKEVFRDYPKLIQIVLIVQAVAILGLLILNLVK